MDIIIREVSNKSTRIFKERGKRQPVSGNKYISASTKNNKYTLLDVPKTDTFVIGKCIMEFFLDISVNGGLPLLLNL